MLEKIVKAVLSEKFLLKVFDKVCGLLRKIIRRLDVVFSFLPIAIARRVIRINDRRIAFMTNSFNYTCNPKYICEQLLESGEDYDIVWVTDSIKKKRESYPPDVKLVQIGTVKCFYYVYSARVWVSNGVDFSNYFKKKKGQVKIQTMHGSLGIKRLDNAVLARNKRGFFGRRVVRRESRDTDLVITNSLFEENVFRSVFWKNTPMKRLGHARTDILLHSTDLQRRYLRQRICTRYGIPQDRKIVLYGPTHRTGLTEDDLNLDFYALIDALQQRFGEKYVVLLRLHNRNAMKLKVSADGERVFNVTDYPDIQELMMITDVAITDYSSWIYDFVETHKYGFIYATDLERYNNLTGLYYKLEDTPFPVAYNNEQMMENVRNFDPERYEERVKAFLEDKQAVDDGHSAQRIMEEINRILEEGHV